MQIRDPQFNADDLKRFVEDLEREAHKDEVIVHTKIKNELSRDMVINIEPQGSGDIFPSGATYEIVALSHKDRSLELHIRETVIVVYAMTCGAIFENGITTLAY